MATQILTWAEFLASIKAEGDVNDTTEDVWLLTTANEILTEICASATESLRDLMIDTTVAIAGVNGITFPGIYLGKIFSVFYQKFAAGLYSRRWDITDVTGVISPAPIENATEAYTAKQTNTAAVPEVQLVFYPIGSGVVGDKIQIIANGFQHITADATLLPYVSFYPFLRRSLLQRLQIKRDTATELVKSWQPLMQSGAVAAGIGTINDGNKVSDDSQKTT